MEAYERILVAIDTPDVEQACTWVSQLDGAVGGVKLGLEFLHAAGPEGVRAVMRTTEEEMKLFLDGKLSDIPNTMKGAVNSLCRLNPWMLNVHAMAGPASMRAALDAAAEHEKSIWARRPLVIAVTVLTSLNRETLNAIGVEGEVQDEVVRLALLAQKCGLDGVVASPLEIEAIRSACGPDFLIVTPGIRPAGADAQDQARLATPGTAAGNGANYLVIGRPLTGAANPREAAEAIAAEIASAL